MNRYLVLACDYDGTIAHHGHVSTETYEALERLKKSGRKIFIVTGRQLEDLMSVFPEYYISDCIVAENGALLYFPDSRKTQILSDPPPEKFIAELRKRGVKPLATGHVIVATWEPMEKLVIETIRDLGLELQIIFNKGAVMVLPAGISKATGLNAACKATGYSPHNVVGVGDAENDHAFLSLCECAVAVSNALPAVKQTADLVTRKDHGSGVAELIDALLATDLRDVEAPLTRHRIQIGTANGSEVFIQPYGRNVLVAGTTGSGKTTLATTFLEKLQEQKYQFCVLDPEGDYLELPNCIIFGSSTMPPDTTELLQQLRKTTKSAIINLLAISVNDRPEFFKRLLAGIQEVRIQKGHPHWIILDELHHLTPEALDPSAILPQNLTNTMMITVYPEHVNKKMLSIVDTIIALGDHPEKRIADFSKLIDQPIDQSSASSTAPRNDMALLWNRTDGPRPFWFNPLLPETKHQRHIRKYAEGDLGEERSFYFRGKEEKLHLKAENLWMFLKIAAGIDDETWVHHLKRHDYSSWFQEMIKDHDLAQEAKVVEDASDLTPAESRQKIKEAIQRRYTTPA